MSQAKRDGYSRKYHKTGGGPKSPEGHWTDQIMEIFGTDSPMFVGVEEGGESGDLSMASKSEVTHHCVNYGKAFVVVVVVDLV